MTNWEVLVIYGIIYCCDMSHLTDDFALFTTWATCNVFLERNDLFDWMLCPVDPSHCSNTIQGPFFITDDRGLSLCVTRKNNFSVPENLLIHFTVTFKPKKLIITYLGMLCLKSEVEGNECCPSRDIGGEAIPPISSHPHYTSENFSIMHFYSCNLIS